MTFDDFLPFVHPSVPSCPRETILFHIKQAAIEFCARSHAWREQLDTLLTDGFSVAMALPLDDQVEIAKLLMVEVTEPTKRKEEATVVDVLTGKRYQREARNNLIAWTDNRKELWVHPTPVVDTELDVLVSLKPAQTAFSFPDDVFDHYAKHIAKGALSSLYRLPKCDWTDSVEAGNCFTEFERHITDAKNAAERGHGKSRARRATNWI